MKTTLSRSDADAIAGILHRAGYATGTTLPDAWGPTVATNAVPAFAADAATGLVQVLEPDASAPVPVHKPVVTSSAPPSGAVRFVDLYHANSYKGVSSPAALAASLAADGVPALVHKASQGLTGRDDTCIPRLLAARAAGLKIGAYHFTEYGDGAAQADNFLAAVGQLAHDPSFLLALDFEPTGAGKLNMTVAQARAFILRVIEVTGRAPVVYGGGGLLRDDLAGVKDAVFALCGLWLAEYSNTAHAIPPTFPAYLFWQYKEDASGIDWNLWQGTPADFRAGWPFMQSLPSAPALAAAA